MRVYTELEKEFHSRSKECKETERKLRKKEEELSEFQMTSMHHKQEIDAAQKKLDRDFKKFKESTLEGALTGLREKLGHVTSKQAEYGKSLDAERGKLMETLEIQKEFIENLRAGTESMSF